jgi:branched-chain amino acid aminotransferase
VVCDLAREEGIPVEADRYSPSTVREASEAFLASAAEGIRPVSDLDGIAVGDGPVTRLLAATLEELIETEYRSH